MKKHVIFDFDGTLLNTNTIIVESWQAVFKKYWGAEVDEDIIWKTFGEPLMMSMEKFFHDKAEECAEYYNQYQKENFSGKVHLFDGMREILDKLHAGGHVLSVVSSRRRPSLYEYLDEFGIRDMFEVVLSCNDVGAHKPDPEPLLKALEMLGAEPDECIMIGDSKYDIGCANNAGVDSVFVGWSQSDDADSLREAGYEATYIINDPEELLGIVR